MRDSLKVLLPLLLLFALAGLIPAAVQAQGLPIPKVTIGVEEAREPAQVALGLQILVLLTVLTLAPALMIMTTSFARIVIVLSFLRQALGTQQLPPNQIIIGLALFLTYFIMAPAWETINQQALQPYLSKQISQQEALKKASEPLRKFMFRQTRQKDLALFISLARPNVKPKSPEDVPTHMLIPAFIISELRTAFQISFLIYIPFLILDMVVSTVLLSMGMMVLPPVIISLPFKLLLFVLVDGWNLIIGSLVKSFA
ncbi:MAG: flagellar type III secretion system pore protein FliP [Candidatus Tectomicrobia bacterium]|uniref:Flagellar biosynthetic protein FliP n=1 Tax=Tectimicrobiota bacterium TaxID=2528274 RepID=A0A932CQI7_UNCTE|nr:flagellar type III secretion system pore protein FliP [Candidatus Tectomicrobia bacterium]